METDVASIKRVVWSKSGRALNPDPARASGRNLLPHLVCQLGISVTQHGLQVLKLFQGWKGVCGQVYFPKRTGNGLKKGIEINPKGIRIKSPGCDLSVHQTRTLKVLVRKALTEVGKLGVKLRAAATHVLSVR